jgi:sugar lactone lactonase YvrE
MSPWLGPESLGSGGPATQILLCYPMGLVIDRNGELLVSDRGFGTRKGRVVWRIASDGTARVVAGSGRRGRAANGPALAARFEMPEGLAVAGDGSFYLADAWNHSVYRVHPDGDMQRVAGTGSPGFSGDGGPGSDAMLHRPADLRLDGKGNLFIADVLNQRVRRVDASGRITTVAGTGEKGFSRDGTLAAQARLDTPWGLGLDLDDRLLIADGGNHRVRRVDDDGRLVTLAGNGRQGFDGDGGPAREASLNFPEALFVDTGGRLFIGDEWNNAIRVVGPDGIISTVMGLGFPGKAAIGGVARHSPLDDPESVVVTPDGVIISDGANRRVIRISTDGIVRLVAGRPAGASCDYW